MKTCNRCKAERPLDEFYEGQKNSWCKPCHSEYHRERNKAGLRNKPTPETARRNHLWAQYRVRPDRYEQMLLDQKGVCATCGEPPDGGKNLHVDHDHTCCPGSKSCGKCVRGLLCGGCNTALGLTKDSVKTLKALVEYLESFATG